MVVEAMVCPQLHDCRALWNVSGILPQAGRIVDKRTLTQFLVGKLATKNQSSKLQLVAKEAIHHIVTTCKDTKIPPETSSLDQMFPRFWTVGQPCATAT